jgi:hypothetical protein
MKKESELYKDIGRSLGYSSEFDPEDINSFVFVSCENKYRASAIISGRIFDIMDGPYITDELDARRHCFEVFNNLYEVNK